MLDRVRLLLSCHKNKDGSHSQMMITALNCATNKVFPSLCFNDFRALAVNKPLAPTDSIALLSQHWWGVSFSYYYQAKI